MAPIRTAPARQPSNGSTDSVRARLSAERRPNSVARRPSSIERRSSYISTRFLGDLDAANTPPPPNAGPFSETNCGALNERAMHSAFDHVIYHLPETRANEVAQSRQIAREMRDPGISSDGARVSDLLSIPPRHVRVTREAASATHDIQQSSSSLRRYLQRLTSPFPSFTQWRSAPMNQSGSSRPRARPRFVIDNNGSPISQRPLRPVRDSMTRVGRPDVTRAARPSPALMPAMGTTPTEQVLPWDSNQDSGNNQTGQRHATGQNHHHDNQDGLNHRAGSFTIWESPPRGGQGSPNSPTSGQENVPQGNYASGQQRAPFGELPVPLDPDHPVQSIEDPTPIGAPPPNGTIPLTHQCHPCPDYVGQYHHVCGRSCPGTSLNATPNSQQSSNDVFEFTDPTPPQAASSEGTHRGERQEDRTHQSCPTGGSGW